MVNVENILIDLYFIFYGLFSPVHSIGTFNNKTTQIIMVVPSTISNCTSSRFSMFTSVLFDDINKAAFGLLFPQLFICRCDEGRILFRSKGYNQDSLL